MRKAGLSLALLIAAGGSASAQEIPTRIFGVYYVPSATGEVRDTPPPAAGVNIPGMKDTGDATGFFAELGTDTRFGYLFGYAQHEMADIEFDYTVSTPGSTFATKHSTDVTENRLGLGLRYRFEKSSVSVSAGYFELKEEHDINMGGMRQKENDGVYGAQLQVGGDYLLTLIGGKGPLLAFGDLSTLDLGDADAFEFRGGLKAMLAPNVGAMLAYRHFELDKDSGQRVTLSGPNVGFTLMF